MNRACGILFFGLSVFAFAAFVAGVYPHTLPVMGLCVAAFVISTTGASVTRNALRQLNRDGALPREGVFWGWFVCTLAFILITAIFASLATGERRTLFMAVAGMQGFTLLLQLALLTLRGH
jgi:hypothetical protein